VPADYAKIRDENIARYGWDTAVLDLLGHLYSERTHFIYELIQNAEDAGATGLAFELSGDRLEARHDGRPFTEADVRAICGVARTDKAGDLTKIGQFGIGFKAVYAYTRTPRIYSDGEHFRIDNYVRPATVDPLDGARPGTLFVFPFDHDSVPAGVAAAEISAALAALDPVLLLFLRSIARIRVSGVGLPGSVIERTAGPGPGAARRVRLAKDGQAGDWLVWQRPLDHLGHAGRQVELAFQVRAGQIVAQARSPLVVYFPTEKETSLGFLVQGPYRTTPARDNVPEHDPANQALVEQTAVLLAEVLPQLRADGLLTVAALQALPLDAARFPAGSMFRPLFDAVRTALAGTDLIPAAGGGYRAAAALRLCDDAGLRDLLSPDQLGLLCGAGQPLAFTDAAITETGTPLLWHYLRDEIGVGVLTPEDFAARLGGDFLAAQPDEWVAQLYAFLDGYPSLCRAGGPARDTPLIRLDDGRQVAAFGPAGQPAVYLPGPAVTGPRTVRRAIAEVPAARHFLEGLGLAEPDLVAEVLDVILPRYGGLDVTVLDPVQHAADLDAVMRALDAAPAGSRSRLLDQLQQTAFLVGENAATGVTQLRVPGGLYQRSRELEAYFDGNPDAWFAADGYGPWLAQLRDMGVRPEVRLRARAADPLGYVVIADEFARHERGVDGFDPGAELDGLDFALAHPGHARSEYVWNALLVPHRELVAGVVETSVRDGFRDASRETVPSVLGAAAAREAWLPGPDGRFRRPAELSLDDLPPGYRRDETLARALGMSQPAVAEAAHQLGVPADVLWGLSAHPDLVALIERELKNRSGDGPDGAGII
jgi:hypothetical protein